ncbi:hypothetical protein BVG16_19835 [Paenibacillus selenitireducens]|uniref:Uncharacterized protein n=1 Tax=Paenibacillus selenitireducens TaxID=1324314 RepID=A0A1T2X7D3_9BACL|nr:hypothetical protein [Paenibacillus selenitireducens]OPA75596.1 hypothetical protein BVG16_19835 [Paenibacillus selenitireducens]
MQTESKKHVRKKWWEPKSTGILRQYAHDFNGTYHEASFKGFSYKSQHVTVGARHGAGTIQVTIIEAGNNNGSSADTMELTYTYRPRRKLEFYLCSAKRLAYSFLQQRLRPTSMPNSALMKVFKGGATHPSMLRSLLKHEQLSDMLLEHPHAEIRLKIKEHNATLTYRERVKKPDGQSLSQGVQLMERLLDALREQSVMHEQ